MKIYQKAKDKNVGANVFYLGVGQKTEETATAILNMYLFENEQDALRTTETKDVSKALTSEELRLAYLAGNMFVCNAINGMIVPVAALLYTGDDYDILRLDATHADVVFGNTNGFTIRGREFDIDEADTDELEPTE